MSGKKVRLRRCVGCGMMFPKDELIRVVSNAEKQAVDLSGKKAGRGAYVCRNSECLAKAQKSRGLERSLKSSVPREIYNSLQGVLYEQ